MAFGFQLIVGSCDGRVSVYEAQRGSLLRSLEPPLPPARRDLTAAAASPSGQVQLHTHTHSRTTLDLNIP